MVLKKTLESPSDCKEIQPVHFEGDRLSNLKDAKNPGLRRKVLCGAITPQQIAVMTSEVSLPGAQGAALGAAG